MRYLLFLCLLFSCAFAQNLPDLTVSGDTLFAPEAKTYQWLRNGAEIPGETGRFLIPTADGSYAVRIQSLESAPVDFAPLPGVVVTGAVLDEFLRPISGVEVRVSGAKTSTDGKGRFYVTAQRAERMTARASIAGYHAHSVGFRPTAADTQFVYIHLAKQVTTHKLPADTGGTISQGGFWLTLPPNSVVDTDGKPYTGEIQLSVVARRPGDRDFAQRMPGGDFMAVDVAGESKVLVSYGFTGVEMTSADGKPLNMAPGKMAQIEFLITEEQRPDAPDEMPLWHFDEDKGLWVEAGTVRKEGLTYKAEVPHFSWWNCDRPQPPAYIECNVVSCWGAPVLGGKIVVNQREAYTDSEGRFNGTVPATIDLDFHVVNTDTTLAPLAAEETRPVGTFNAGWGAFEAVGIADENNLLTVYAFGETAGVEYSLDGETWQSEPVFVLEGDSVASHGWARLQNCSAISFHNYQPAKFNNCRVYELEELDSIPFVKEIRDLSDSKETVYQVDIGYRNLEEILKAGLLQSCVQTLFLNDCYSSSNDDLNQICRLWPNLRQISLKAVELNRWPESINKLNRLRLLILENLTLTSLPESVGEMADLEYFMMVSTPLSSLPESIGNMVSLKVFHLTIAHLTSVPESIGNLNQLYWLNLSNNQLSELPESIGNLESLRTFIIFNNQLPKLPESIGNLDSLSFLSLDDNRLTTLPDSIGKLSGLKKLGLKNNPLQQVPQVVGKLASLTLLNLDNTQLTNLPDTLKHLTALQELYLSSNQMTTLPDLIGSLSTLQKLYFTKNQLTYVPDTIANLSALQDLYLSGNQLTSLPDAMGNLASIKNLVLSNNKLTSLPASFANLADTLKKLHLEGNPISPEERSRIRAMLPNTTIYF